MKTTNKRIKIITLLVSLALALSVAGGPLQGVGEASPGETYPVYLPILTRTANNIYGHVTDNGSPAANVSLQLWRETGITASPLITVTTNLNGDYYFQYVPALGPDQSYWVQYDNETNPDRLSAWYTRELTSFPDGSTVNIGNFDLANIPFTSPTPRSEVVLPYSFQWTPRPATPTDSYQFGIFDYYDLNPSFLTAPLGNVGSYNLTNLPGGFQYCNLYFWVVNVFSPDGGLGYSYWAYSVTFHQSAQSGIHGCVTENSIPVSGVTVELLRWTGSAVEHRGTTNTSNGYYSFTGQPSLSGGQEYWVQYENATNSNRLAYYWTSNLTSYTTGSAAFIGDFDIKEIPLNLPSDGVVIGLPATFDWDLRPNTQVDNYSFELYDPNDFDPWFESARLGYEDHYTLGALPPGFSPGVWYAWDVLVYDWWGGLGLSWDWHNVSFSSMSRGEAALQTRLDQRRVREEQRERTMLTQPGWLINRANQRP